MMTEQPLAKHYNHLLENAEHCIMRHLARAEREKIAWERLQKEAANRKALLQIREDWE